MVAYNMFTEGYALNRFYHLLMKIIDISGKSEEQVQSEIIKYIEERRATTDVINGIEHVARELGLDVDDTIVVADVLDLKI